MDLRRLPRRQSGPGCEHGWRPGDPGARPRPDGDRQPGARRHPPGPVAGHGGARLRPARRDDGAHAGADRSRLRGGVPARRAGRDAGCGELDAQDHPAGDEGGRWPVLEAPGRRAHRGRGAGHPSRQAVLAAAEDGTRCGGRPVRGTGGEASGDAAARPRQRGRRAGARRGVLAQRVQFARPPQGRGPGRGRAPASPSATA